MQDAAAATADPSCVCVHFCAEAFSRFVMKLISYNAEDASTQWAMCRVL